MPDAAGEACGGGTIEVPKPATLLWALRRVPKPLRPDLVEERVGLDDALGHRRHDASVMIDRTHPKSVVEGNVVVVGVPGGGKHRCWCNLAPQADEFAKITLNEHVHVDLRELVGHQLAKTLYFDEIITRQRCHQDTPP